LHCSHSPKATTVLHTARPSHPGHSTILLRSETPERHVRKASHLAASNNMSSHAMITLLLLVRATYIFCCSSRTSRSWWITQSTQRQRRGCNTTYIH